ncbi:MAG: hypothetical protein WDW36_010036 [Sanguina aurantia]
MYRSLWQDSKGYQHFGGRGDAWGAVSSLQSRIAIGSVAAAFAGYYLYSREEVPYSHRTHSIMFVSMAHEASLGKAVFDMHRQEAAREGRLLPDNHPYAQLVRRVGNKIASKASDGHGGGFFKHMQGLHWEFAVVDNHTPNAYVLPGGKVVVFSGLLEILSREDEVAAVLAHEVSHVLARHQAERMSTLNIFTIINITFRWLFGLPVPNAAIYLGVFLPYARRAEHEADALGLSIMSRACYDPTAMPAMLAKLSRLEAQAEAQTGQVPAFLRTHPLTSSRVDLVKEKVPAASKLYNDSGCAVQRGFFSRGAEFMR